VKTEIEWHHMGETPEPEDRKVNILGVEGRIVFTTLDKCASILGQKPIGWCYTFDVPYPEEHKPKIFAYTSPRFA
jgi:hypothetical protein